MNKCVICSKDLSRTTKGELCIICYRNRNKDSYDSNANVENNSHLENTHINASINDGTLSLNNSHDADDRLIIDMIKSNMLQERNQQDELTSALKSQITFMKEEIQHKNELIMKLMAELTVITTKDGSQSINDRVSVNSNCSNYVNENNVIPITTNYMQWQNIDEAKESNDFNTNPMNDDASINMDSSNKRTLIVDEDSDFETVTRKNVRKFKSDERKQRNTTFQSNQIRRPPVVTNNYPERDNNYYQRSTKHVPGNSTYANMTNQGKKVAIMSDSICGGIYMPKMNKSLINKYAFKSIHPGSTPEDLNYYCVRTLKKENPDIAIINVGTNKIGRDDPFTIAKDITNIVKTCQQHGCNKVFVSSITYRSDYQNEVLQLNNILEAWQVIHDFKLIYNNNIDATCISKDGIHLNNKGKAKICSNFINVLNKLHN